MNNVLIIEDDKEICVMIKDHLEKYNYQVFFTLTGANAIERIKELSPDLIILDLMLPFISGDELIRNIRKFSDVPVIVVSAKSLTFNKVELLRLGADDYLNQVSMSVMQGDIYGFIGENGAGKTTMIRLLTGLAEPTTGKIALFGESNKKLAKQRDRIGCIIESPSLYLDMTAYENLEVQRLQRGIPGKGCIDNALALVGLKDTGKKKAKDFSLGMRQRLALAIALLGNPEFLVLDEPINGLDPTGIIELRNLLKRLNKERGITILISSHILTELHQLANRYGILHEGKLLQEITATELDKRCKKHLLLQVNDVAAASVLLESKLNTSNFSVMPDKSIHLYDYVENAGKVSALLSANNITIYQLAQSGDSLETYYTNLIGGCQND